ncbi:MAG: hypothetical protein IK145_08620 [Bacteroidales bacterium]|nr:hypothetical protein [Bacteroidales bacterium]
MMNNKVRNILIYAGIVAFFLVLAYAFVPEVLSGKIVNQSDITGFKGMSREASVWNASHPDDPARWTGSMFGGMPTTSFMPSSEGDWTQSLYDLMMTGKRPATWLFISLLGAFLLMLSLGINKFLAIGGAVAVTFCSYNLQIIQVGHNTKMQALAFLPWVLAAVIFTYRKALAKKEVKGWKGWLPQTLLGAVLFGLALSLQIKANHQQITYYLAIMIVIYALALAISLLCSKEGRASLGRFFAASALLLVVGLAGIGTNAIKLAPLYEYSKYTMRGGSELSNPTGGQVNKDGLQLDYATAWSYGWEELPNLMIPDFNGGSSAGLVNPDKSEVAKLFKQYGQSAPERMPYYWGPQPFTAGPMYMGAISIFLFLLGLFLYKGKEKWWMLAATIVAVFLALGNHFMWFTKLFFDYAPMYNKFRTVSMALVILQFTLPMLGFLVLDRLMKGEYTKKEFLKKGWPALALTAGICLLVALIPSLAGKFSAPSDGQMQDVIADALRADRIRLLRTDALWSAVVILLAFCLVFWSFSVPKQAPESRRKVAMAGICFLVLVNMFAVGKRYLNSGDFTTPRQFDSHFTAREVDKAILEDKSPSFRVADLTADIFNDNYNPYWHKSVGGYSPAKLQRYQDLIDRYLVGELQGAMGAARGAKTLGDFQDALPEMKVLSALNTKYFILGADFPPVENKQAYGPAWFVESFVDAATPDDEIGLLAGADLRKEAILGRDFEEIAKVFGVSFEDKADLRDSIWMTSYSPNELHYRYVSAYDRPAVFSEIYYPDGWKATVDGAEIQLFRADWVLRGAVLPAGEHEVVMRFEPKVYTASARTSRASSATLLVLLLLSLGGMCVKES